MTIWSIVSIGCTCLALYIVLLIATPFILNWNAKRWAKKVVDSYLEALQRKDFTQASTFVSKVVLQNDMEKLDWIRKMTKIKGNSELIHFSITNVHFEGLSGRYTGTATVSLLVNETIGNEVQSLSYKIRLSEEEQNEPSSLRIFDSPDIMEEAKERVHEHFLQLKPSRKVLDNKRVDNPE